MTLIEMRDCIDAAIAGKKIERIVIKYPEGAAPQWLPHLPNYGFNFDDYDYRIKPEPREFWICGGAAFKDRNDALEYGTPIHAREVLPDE